MVNEVFAPQTTNRTWMTVSGLGVSQIISWGTLYYSLAVLAQPIHVELGLSQLQIFGAFTLSMLVSGSIAPVIGRTIDRRGGRKIMASSSVLAALAFLIMSVANGQIVFALAWVIAGVAMAGTLYEPAFATLHQSAPTNYRKAVTVLTVFGGFASTLFWPLTHVLEASIGWRGAFVVFATLHMLVCVPIHALLIPSLKKKSNAIREVISSTIAPMTTAQFRWLALSFAASTFVFSVLSVFLIQTFGKMGFSTEDAIWIAALIGPAQVLGRSVEWLISANVSTRRVGAFAFFGLLLALLMLGVGFNSLLFGIVFALFYGMSNGVMTVVRATLPLELFGNENAGALFGKMAMPVFVTKALAPATFAAAYQWGLGFNFSIWILVGLALMAFLSFILALRARPTAITAS